MEWVVTPITEIVKPVVRRFGRYLKYLRKYNDLLQKFEQNKQRLHDRKHEIETKRDAQLEGAVYHVVTEGVKDWLKEAEEFITKQGVVAEANSWWCLSCCCRAVILEERTREWKKIYDAGENYTRDSLVIEDHSKKRNYYVKNFDEWKGKLERKQKDIDSTLRSQLVHGKIEKEEVKYWRGKVEEMLKGVKDIEDKIGGSPSHSSNSLVMLLGEKNREMETMCKEGSQLPDCLVIEDQSKKCNYYVQNFNELKDKLQCKRADIGAKLNSQLVFGKIEMEEVKRWRGKVEEMLRGVKDIEDKIGGSHSLSSDSLVVLLGEKIREMETMCNEGSRLPDCLVIDDPSASAVELLVPKLQGNEAVIEEISACLKGEEVAKFGVWGMGGIGKTTIMRHVHNELLKEGTFKKVIWVTVSQNFDIYNLQEQIACNLCSRKEKQELKDQNTTVRAGMLLKMLKEDKHKPYLLIFDDVWEIFDLNEVGIPGPDVADGNKFVMTTRSQEVARSMDCRRIQVETLSEEEALKLFLNKVGGTALSCQGGGGIKEDLKSTLKEIVDECDGLPLALITVAGSLKGVSESRLWSVALNQLRDCKRNVAGTDADAFRTLKFSYDRLENQQIKYCFLYCALYPEDYKIPKQEIIEKWIDEGFIDEMESRQSMKDEGYGILRKLEDNSLLEFTRDRYERGGMRMHDLIRDMALHITKVSPQFLVEAGKSLTELPEKVKCTEDVEKVSVMFNQIEDIPSSMASSTCIRLTTLLLAHNKLSTIPESVFEHMLELKILDLSFNKELTSLPNSVSKLVKLTTLLLESTSLKKVPSLSGLGSLKKLNLRRTEIEKFPEGLGMLKNLKCLFFLWIWNR